VFVASYVVVLRPPEFMPIREPSYLPGTASKKLCCIGLADRSLAQEFITLFRNRHFAHGHILKSKWLRRMTTSSLAACAGVVLLDGRCIARFGCSN
jgi:hypothetical protein